MKKIYILNSCNGFEEYSSMRLVAATTSIKKIKSIIIKQIKEEEMTYTRGNDGLSKTKQIKMLREDWEKMGVFNLKMVNPTPTVRAYSMACYPAEGDIIKLNVRIATPPFDRAAGKWLDVNPGVCSSYIYSLKPGDKITISGPYGEFFLPKNLPADQELIFVGGGAGMAPMRSHIMHLFKTEKTSRKVNFFYGARSLKEAFYLEDYSEIQEEFPNFKFHLALDRPDPAADEAGVPYVAGFVHNVMYETYLKQHENPEDALYLMCGPPMMVASVVKLLDSLGVPPENILYDNFGA